MKKLAFPLMAALILSACGSAPGQISGNASVGIAVADSGSTEVATKTVTPATDKTPEKISWTITPGTGVTFTFMTRPGSEAVYLNGYRIVERTITTANGTQTYDDYSAVTKMDLYLTSGYSCAARTALNSCPYSAADTVPANGLTGQYTIYMEDGLGDLVVSTNASVFQVTSIEFFGTTSNGKNVTFKADGIVSSGSKQGDL